MAVSKANNRVWEFGPFRLDEAERLLRRGKEIIALTPKVFDTLVALVERSGHLIEKEELMARLWPDTYVEEGALTRNISDLRKALGGEKYVETVPKRGYRFVAPVRELHESQTTYLVEKTTETRLVIEEEAAEVRLTALPPAIPPADQQQTRRSVWSLKSRFGIWLACGVLIVGGVLGVREFIKSRRSSNAGRDTFQAMQVSRFTASGNIVTAAISPDGKYIATVQDEGGLQSLWVRQVAANTSSVRLLDPALVDYWGLTFSNDSNFIYYVSWVRNESNSGLFQLPVLGGTPRRLPLTPDTPISFSPSDNRLACVYTSSTRGESFVKVSDADGGQTQILMKRQKPGFVTAYPGGPAWSPDGRFIACAAGSSVDGDRLRVQVFVVDVEGKEERPLTAQSWWNIGRVSWLSDGSGLVISAREQMDAPRQLWFVSYPEGLARKITNDLHDYDSVSLSADAKTIAAVQIQETSSIAVVPYGGSHPVHRSLPGTDEIFSEVGSGRERVAWTPDNRIAYGSRAGGNWDIWVMNKDGSGQKQLTVDPHNDIFPAVSADGRSIFFASDRAGTFNIWRMDIDGNNPVQLTHGVNQTLPEVTPDGHWVIYQHGLEEPTAWRVPVAGGEPQRLVEGIALRPVTSPDSRRLAYVYLDEKGWGWGVCSLEGGVKVGLKGGMDSRKLPFPATVGSRLFRWTPDGGSLAFIATEKGASNIWRQPLNGDPPERLTDFTAGELMSFAWSADGQWLACMHHTATRDVVLLRDFR